MNTTLLIHLLVGMGLAMLVMAILFLVKEKRHITGYGYSYSSGHRVETIHYSDGKDQVIHHPGDITPPTANCAGLMIGTTQKTGVVTKNYPIILYSDETNTLGR